MATQGFWGGDVNRAVETDDDPAGETGAVVTSPPATRTAPRAAAAAATTNPAVALAPRSLLAPRAATTTAAAAPAVSPVLPTVPPLDPRALRPSGKVPPIVSWQGKQAFQVTYRGGKIHIAGSGANATFDPPGGVFPCSACRASFSIWFEDNFPWTKTGSHKVGGKLGGFMMGSGKATGGDYSTTAASLRLTFRDGGVGSMYAYPQLRINITDGQPTWPQADQTAAFRGVSTIAKGIHVYRRDDTLTFRKGAWNDVKLTCVLNAPGRYDGLIRLEINGRALERTDARLRYTPDVLITRFVLSSFFGGGTKAYAPPADTRAWFADYKFERLA